MSEQVNNISSPLDKAIIQEIEELDLDLFQKHHVRLLVHCLEIFRQISLENKVDYPNEDLIRKWSELHSKNFNDDNFSSLLLQQMIIALKKLDDYSKKIGKKLLDLDLKDLIFMTSQNL